jgi:transposase
MSRQPKQRKKKGARAKRSPARPGRAPSAVGPIPAAEAVADVGAADEGDECVGDGEEVVAGIDVHASTFVAAVLAAVGAQPQIVECESAMPARLGDFGPRLAKLGVTRVAVEATGVYWMRLHVLLTERGIETILANPAQVKAVAGRKADAKDATRLAFALQSGSLAASFIASPEQRELRDLTRARTSFVRARSAFKNRIHKVLRANGIPLNDAVSDIFGQATMPCLVALAKGKRPDLSDRALLRLDHDVRREVREALGIPAPLSAGARIVLQLQLAALAQADSALAALDVAIAAWLDQRPAWRDGAKLLDTIPGIAPVAAAALLAEIGADVSRFRSEQALASWAGLCPGQHESAGKKLGSRTPHGNVYVRRALGSAAQTFARRIAPDTNGHAFHQRMASLKCRMPFRKAVVVLAHKMLRLAWTLLTSREPCSEERHHADCRVREERRQWRIARSLTRDGWGVTPPPDRQRNSAFAGASC